MEEQLIGGKALTAWDNEWDRLDGGLRVPHPKLRNLVGLFRIIWRDMVVFVGCATEHTNGGLTKRLADFVRPSANGRNHHAGTLIHEHRDQVKVEVLVLGDDYVSGITAKQLKSAYLRKLTPLWNV